MLNLFLKLRKWFNTTQNESNGKRIDWFSSFKIWISIHLLAIESISINWSIDKQIKKKKMWANNSFFFSFHFVSFLSIHSIQNQKFFAHLRAHTKCAYELLCFNKLLIQLQTCVLFY